MQEPEELSPKETIISEKKGKSKWFVVLVIILLVLIAGYGGFFYWQNTNLGKQSGVKQGSDSQNNQGEPYKAPNINGDSSKAEEKKYSIEDAKKLTSNIGGFTVYYPKTWFSSKELKPQSNFETYGFTTHYGFYSEEDENDATGTYILLAAITNPGRTIQEEADIDSDSIGAVKQEKLVYQGADTIKLTTDKNGKEYYEEQYIFQKNAVRYSRQRVVEFIISLRSRSNAEFEKNRTAFNFILDNIALDQSVYGVNYTVPTLSGLDEQRKNDLWAIEDALDRFYQGRGEVPLAITYDGMIQRLINEGYLDYAIQDPSPYKKYRYGSSCSSAVAYKAGTCFYRVDAVFDDPSITLAKQDGGVDNSRYEIGSALGQWKANVQYMSE